jgi:hypothetical protein
VTRRTLYGSPLPVAPKSAVTVLVLEPSTGFSQAQPATDLQPGQTPYSMNFVMREGGLELRPTLSSFTSNANPVGPVTGGYNLVSSTGSNYPIVSGQTRLAYFSSASYQWSELSYTSSGGRSTPLSQTTVQYTDIVQSYEPVGDEMVAVIAAGSYETLFAWKAGTATYSSITSAPRAKYLTTADNFVLAANVRDSGSQQSYYVQRVQWSDRGGPLTWAFSTGNLAGFEDLLDAKGAIMRITTLDNIVVVFFRDEIWQGVRAQSGSAAWSFTPLDRTVGCSYPWTVATTPLGTVFLGRNYVVYLLPKGGGPAAPIGGAVRRWLADRIINPELAWSTFDPTTYTYRLHYATAGSGGTPTEAIWLNIGENSWAPQNYEDVGATFALTRGFLATRDIPIPDLTWNSLISTGEAWSSIASSWRDFYGANAGQKQSMTMGSSVGSMYYEGTGNTDTDWPVLATWRSQALDQDSPGVMGVLQEVRMDYEANAPSNFSFRASRDQGATWEADVSKVVPSTPAQGVVNFFPYVAAPYPTFEVKLSTAGLRIYRFWVKLRQGGRL